MWKTKHDLQISSKKHQVSEEHDSLIKMSPGPGLCLVLKFNCECGTRCVINKCHHFE